MAALGLIFTAPLAFSQSFIRSIQATDRSKGQGPIASTVEACAFIGPFANNPGWGNFWILPYGIDHGDDRLTE